MIIWVAWMSRWGEPSPENAYAKGVYSDPDRAREVGEAESLYRGQKYEFQHCPAYLDMKRPSLNTDEPAVPAHAGKHVYVAWVSNFGRCHFLGVFRFKEGAIEAARNMYPGWKVESEKHIVDHGKE